MKKTLKGYLLGFLSAALLLSGVVYAASSTKSIEVVYDNIKVYKDNVLCETKDANGNVVEPFIYNGTTYMPVRGTANLAGMDVTWDGITKSVYLWNEMTADDTYLMDVCPPYLTDDAYEAYLGSQGKYFEMANEKYTNGFTLAASGAAYFKLDAKYSSMELTVISDGVAEGTISFIVDDKLVESVDMNHGDLPKKVTVPLNNGLQLKIVNPGGMGSAYKDFGFGNIIVK